MAAAPKERITLAELRRRARAGDLAPKHLRAFFEIDEKRSKAMAPALRLNPTRVDTKGKQLSPADVAAIFESATAKLKPTARRPRRRVRAGAPRAALAAPIRVLAEGDSWFNLPDFLMPKDALDVLRETYTVVSLAKWGDTIENMVLEKQYRQKLKAGTKFRHFLFSGGGNDVLGSIGTFVSPRNPGDTDPYHAAGYVKPTFAGKVNKIIKLYEMLADDVRSFGGAATVLYVHGYANAIPKKDGPYLGKRLAALGFDLPAAAPLAEAIVAHMVATLNGALKNFAASRAGIVYVDMRGKLGRNDWNTDEIHPNAAGARKVAGAFAAAIGANALTS